MTVAERVWLLVEVSGMTLNAAASAMGIPQPSLSSIASGRSKKPRVGHLGTIARFYGVPFTWLAYGEGDWTAARILCDHADAKASATKRMVCDRLGYKPSAK